MKLTQTQLRDYLKAGGLHCPLCRSSDIEGGPVEVDPYGAQQPMSCLACDCEWRDIHKRVDVVIEKGE